MASTLPTPNDCCSSTCDCTSNTDITDLITDLVGTGNTLGVDNIEDLRAVVSYQDNQLCAVFGVTTPGDTAMMWYRFDAAETAADNGSTIIKPDDTPEVVAGRWIQGL